MCPREEGGGGGDDASTSSFPLDTTGWIRIKANLMVWCFETIRYTGYEVSPEWQKLVFGRYLFLLASPIRKTSSLT